MFIEMRLAVILLPIVMAVGIPISLQHLLGAWKGGGRELWGNAFALFLEISVLAGYAVGIYFRLKRNRRELCPFCRCNLRNSPDECPDCGKKFG